ncbi:LacI family DNA-binding transcriptional regulator [Paenibacillus sp. D9]|uniref:LacI family DNA-binding transcriptional regulator n=1 Tax=Paenibacillus TaxID=44249 RepID=UPI000675EAD7|nr:LacI family DNA-binding transcriptional regulator [Paenibacillus sp. D9]
MKPSIFDVAKRSGLSVVTVSRVLNGSGNVRENNRLKVLSAMKELDYRPSAAARTLARGSTGVIGLTLSTLQDSVFDAIVKSVHDELSAQGYFLALSIAPESGEPGSSYLIRENRVDGVIVLSPSDEDEIVRELEQSGIPYIVIDSQDAKSAPSTVKVDHETGGYMACRHLTELGLRKIAHLSGPAHYDSTRERKSGFLRALQEAGLEPFLIEAGDYSIENGYRSARRWLEENRLPEAVFAGDDYIAAGIINALQEAGLSVPRDLSVVGFDDQNLASLLHPLLTTVRQPVLPIAQAAVHALMARMEDGAAPEGVVIQPELVIRESTGRSASPMVDNQEKGDTP